MTRATLDFPQLSGFHHLLRISFPVGTLALTHAGRAPDRRLLPVRQAAGDRSQALRVPDRRAQYLGLTEMEGAPV